MFFKFITAFINCFMTFHQVAGFHLKFMVFTPGCIAAFASGCVFVFNIVSPCLWVFRGLHTD